MDSLIFASDSVKDMRIEEPANAKKNSHVPQFENDDATKKVAQDETEEVEVENVERPVDLYKAIFSDDSDDEGEESNVVKEENQEKKAEVANTALSRLIAGDFLESLGKELGLEVPPDMPYPAPKSRSSGPQKETSDENARNDIPNTRGNGEVSLNPQDDAAGISERDPIYGNMLESGSSKAKGTNIAEGMSSKCIRETDDHGSRSSSEEEKSRKRTGHESKSNKLNGEKDDERKIKTPSTRRHDYSRSSYEEERNRKHPKPHRHRSRHDSGSDSSSDDDQDSYRSRSKGKNKGSSRKKSRSRKHLKHHDRRSRDSPSRSSRHRKEKDHTDDRREKKRRE